jgi:6,7-dimethyl-8-ribityllumazine synthase
MENIKLGIVAAEFNYEITYAMVELAKEHAKFLGVVVEDVVKVPGVFDMPLAVKMLLERCDINCVVTLGAVIEGQTEHDEIVAQHATRKIADLALDYNKPVGLGISGPGMSRLDAHKRIDYAKKAVEAAVKMCRVLESGGAGGCNCSGGEKPDEGEDEDEKKHHVSPPPRKRIIETG